MNVKVELKGDVFKIYIDNLLHLYICEPILSLQSWNEQNKFYKVQYKTKSQTITTEYDSMEKWKQLLKEIDKCLS